MEIYMTEKKCPTCGTYMTYTQFSYYGTKGAVFVDEDKLITVDEWECPKCGHFDHKESVS